MTNAASAQDTDEGIIGKGLHRDRNFETYEDEPWVLRSSDIGDRSVTFECVSGACSSTMEIALLDDGRMQLRYISLDPENLGFAFTYRRAD